MLVIEQLIEKIRFNEKGLVAVIAQDFESKEVLMMAWMNEESLRLSLEKKEMVYFSRSRNQLWHKGEQSKNFQKIHHLMLDCDGDTLLALVEQVGGIACHTGRKSCFYQKLTKDGLVDSYPVLKSSQEMYGE